MSSLRDQLKKLATPAVDQFRPDIRKKKSLIHGTDAAKIDYETHYKTAKNAFQHLVNLDGSFAKYETKLFSEASINYEPSIQDLDMKAKVDSYIQRFLTKISPFLEIPDIPLTILEWLVQRYQVHMYQPDDFIRCVLPYHDKALFPKFVQLIDLEAHGNRRWAWLRPIADNGVPLSKDELILMCSRDMDVLLFICRTLEISLKIMKHNTKQCKPMISLFTQIALGLITRQTSVDTLGRILAHLVSPIEAGLSSSRHPEYKAAAYVIVSSILRKTRLHESIAKHWIEVILTHPPQRRPESALLLVSLIANRHNMDCLDIEMAELVIGIFNALPSDVSQGHVLKGSVTKLVNTVDSNSNFDVTNDTEKMDVDIPVEPEVVDEAENENQNGEVPKQDMPHVREKKILREARKTQSPENLLDWLLATALAGSENPDSVVPELYAIHFLEKQIADVAWTCENKAKMEKVLVTLLLFLQHNSSAVREAALNCLQSIKRLLDSVTDGLETGIPESRAFRKLLKVKDRRLLIGDRTFLQQDPYNTLIVKEYAKFTAPDQMFAAPPKSATSEQSWRIWRNQTKLLWSYLNRATLSEAIKQCPTHTKGLIHLLEISKPKTPEGDFVWSLWHEGLYEALPDEIRSTVLDIWFATASTRNEKFSKKTFEKLKIPVSELKRLLQAMLPRKIGGSARELIMRKRSLASVDTQAANKTLAENKAKILCLLEHMQQCKWEKGKEDLSPWTLVLPLLECLQIAMNVSLAAFEVEEPATVPSKKMKENPTDLGEGMSEDSSDESEVIAEYESEDHNLNALVKDVVRGVLGALYSLLKALPDSGATSDVALEALLDCLCRDYGRQVQQTALLAVSEVARLRPALLLRNMLPLLTFMRCHVFPLDDAYTLEVIGRVLDCAIPAYIRADTAIHKSPEIATVKVLEVLVDSFHHVPTHRRLPLFKQLGICIMEANTKLPPRLWTLIALLSDRLTRATTKASQPVPKFGVKRITRSRTTSGSLEEFAKFMEPEPNTSERKKMSIEGSNFLCQLLSEFPVLLQIRTCADLLNFIRAHLVAGLNMQSPKKPRSPESPPRKRRRTASRNNVSGDDSLGPDDLELGTTATLVQHSVGCRALSDCFILSQGLSTALSVHLASPSFLKSFVNTPAVPGHGEGMSGAVEALVQEVLQMILLAAGHVQAAGKESNSTVNSWRHLLHVIYQILEKIHTFLPVTQHLSVVLRLCTHSLPVIQRKTLEILHGRLTALPAAAGNGPHAMTALRPQLLRALSTVEQCICQASGSERERSLVIQTSLVCAKELARLLATDNGDRFVVFLQQVGERVFRPEEVDLDSNKFSSGNSALDEEACGYVLLAEVMKHQPKSSVAIFERLLPRLLAQLNAHRSLLSSDNQQLSLHRAACISLCAAVSSSPAKFLSRSNLQDLVQGIVRVEAEWNVSDKANQQKLSLARKNLAEHANPKNLLLCIGECFRHIMKHRQWHWSVPLMRLWERHINKLEDEAYANLVTERHGLIYKLCINALSIRDKMMRTPAAAPQSWNISVAQCEEASLFAIMACLKKMNAGNRDDLMEMLFDWTRANTSEPNLHRQTAFFRLGDCLASRIPDVLVAACTHLELFEFASTVLSQLRNQEVEPSAKIAEEQDLLMRSLLSMLSAFFTTDESKGLTANLSANTAIQTLIPAIVSALEVLVGGLDCYRERCDLFLLPCLATLAEASGADETLLQPLCHQVCLRMKSPDWNVRLCSLRTMMGFVDRLGTVFENALLQDCLPYLAECLEDDQSEVQDFAYEVCEKIRRTCGGELDF